MTLEEISRYLNEDVFRLIFITSFGLFSVLCLTALYFFLSRQHWWSRRYWRHFFQSLLYKRSQAKLEMLASVCQPLLDDLPFPVWKRDDNGDLIFCNRYYAKALGITVEQVLAEQHELSPMSRHIAARARELKAGYAEQHYLIDGDKRRLYQITESFAPSGFIGFAQNQERLESLENERKQNLATQQDLMEITSNAIAIFDANTQLKYFNTAYAQLWKFSPEWLATSPYYREILEKQREERLLPEQVNFQAFKKNELSLFTDLITKREEFYYLPDGTVLRVLTLPHQRGGLLFSYSDVTEQINLERSYNTLMSVKKMTIDNLYEALAVFGEDGRLQLSNPMFLKMWGIPNSEEVEDIHINEVLMRLRSYFDFDDDGWLSFREDFNEKMHRRRSSKERLERKDGKIVELAFVPLPDGATLLIFSDVTDTYLVERSLRAEKEALAEADTIKTKFLANVSYELRSPLTSIVGFSEALKAQYFGALNDKQMEYLDDILQASSRLTSLIDNILDVASIDAGYMQLDLSTFSLRELFEDTLAKLRDSMEIKDITLEISCPKNVGTLTADRKRIQQILIQLLRNSVRMTEPGGKVTLFAKRQKNKTITLGVKDTGKGIPEEEQENVFEKFYKLRADSYSGTGLGLTLAKSFVEMHGGKITLQSKVGEGTTLSFRLKDDNRAAPEKTA